jgi:hypothetical protein
MSWIRIDAQHGQTIGHVMVDSGHRNLASLARLRALRGIPGLGSAAGEVDAVVSDSTAILERASEEYLREGVDMVNRLIALIKEQAATSVIGQVTSPAVAIGAGTVVGGYASIGQKSWAQGVATHTSPVGETYAVVPNPRAGELLGAGMTGQLRFTESGQPYYVQPDPLAPTGVATVVYSAAPLPSAGSSAQYNAVLNNQAVTLAMPPMWAAKVFANAVSIGAGSLNPALL